MKVILLSYMDDSGAGKASVRLRNALIKIGINAELWVHKKRTKYSKIIFNSFFQRLIIKVFSKLNYLLLKLQITKSKEFHSIDFFSLSPVDIINNSDADIVQINWVNNLLSVKDISNIKKPIAWRFSDMWPICGAEHYVQSNDKRWINGYSNKNSNIKGWDLNMKMWKKKFLFWKNPINLILPSKWLNSCVKKSRITKSWPSVIISTPIDTNIFKIYDQSQCRNYFDLENKKKILLYGANLINEERKGYKIIKSILYNYSSFLSEYQIVVFGKENENLLKEYKNIVILNYINNEKDLAKLYSAADIFLLPSLQDNLPQTGLEAQCCGLPLVTFNATGTSEIILHKKTGYLAKPYYPESFIEGINWLKNAIDDKKINKKNIQKRAHNIYDPIKIAQKYKSLYNNILKKKYL